MASLFRNKNFYTTTECLEVEQYVSGYEETSACKKYSNCTDRFSILVANYDRIHDLQFIGGVAYNIND